MSAVAKMKVAELREALDARGLDVKGTKPFLVTRLEEVLAKEEAKESSAGPVVEEPGAQAKEPGAQAKAVKNRILEQVATEAAQEAAGTPTTPSTPTRRSRRLSEDFTGQDVTARLEALEAPRPGTPTRKRPLELEAAVTPRRRSKLAAAAGPEELPATPGTPGRRSRRLSGCGAEEAVASPAPAARRAPAPAARRAPAPAPAPAPAARRGGARGGRLPGGLQQDMPEVIQEAEEEVEEEEIEVANEATQVNKKIEKKAFSVDDKENVATPKDSSPALSNLDSSLVKATNAVIASTNDVITTLRKELDGRKSLVAAKQIPRQRPKSGKFWKEGRSAFRAIKKDKGQKMTFEQRLAKKEEKTKNKELALLLMQRKSMKKEEMRKKIEENKARKSENEKKSEQFQVIKNPAKIKRMKKKQLRQLEKRDLLAKS